MPVSKFDKKFWEKKPIQSVSEIRQKPYDLPSNLYWGKLNILSNENDLSELSDFLSENYVEDNLPYLIFVSLLCFY